MIAYRHYIAYRYPNGDVEGFVGFSDIVFGTKAEKKKQAEADAIDQIQRKHRNFPLIGKPAFDPARVVKSEKDLTPEELESVRRDWKTNLRY